MDKPTVQVWQGVVALRGIVLAALQRDRAWSGDALASRADARVCLLLARWEEGHVLRDHEDELLDALLDLRALERLGERWRLVAQRAAQQLARGLAATGQGAGVALLLRLWGGVWADAWETTDLPREAAGAQRVLGALLEACDGLSGAQHRALRSSLFWRVQQLWSSVDAAGLFWDALRAYPALGTIDKPLDGLLGAEKELRALAGTNPRAALRAWDWLRARGGAASSLVEPLFLALQDQPLAPEEEAPYLALGAEWFSGGRLASTDPHMRAQVLAQAESIVARIPAARCGPLAEIFERLAWLSDHPQPGQRMYWLAAAAHATADPRHRARRLVSAASYATNAEDHAGAAGLLTEARAALEEIDPLDRVLPRWRMHVLCRLAHAKRDLGDRAAAEALYEEAFPETELIILSLDRSIPDLGEEWGHVSSPWLTIDESLGGARLLAQHEIERQSCESTVELRREELAEATRARAADPEDNDARLSFLLALRALVFSLQNAEDRILPGTVGRLLTHERIEEERRTLFSLLRRELEDTRNHREELASHAFALLLMFNERGTYRDVEPLDAAEELLRRVPSCGEAGELARALVQRAHRASVGHESDAFATLVMGAPWLARARALDPSVEEECTALERKVDLARKFFAPPPVQRLAEALGQGWIWFASSQVRALSYGEVTEGADEGCLSPHGLWSRRIFGPVIDFCCACARYRGEEHRGIVCESCGVEVIQARARLWRVGHVVLAAPVVHPWVLYGRTCLLAKLLPIAPEDLRAIAHRTLALAEFSPGVWGAWKEGANHWAKPLRVFADGVKGLQEALSRYEIERERETIEAALARALQRSPIDKPSRRVVSLQRDLSLVDAILRASRDPAEVILSDLLVLPPRLTGDVLIESDIPLHPEELAGAWPKTPPDPERLRSAYEEVLRANQRVRAALGGAAEAHTAAGGLQQAVEGLFACFGSLQQAPKEEVADD